MSTQGTDAAAASSAPTVKMPVMPLLLSVLLAVMLAVGGCAAVMFGLLRSGKLGAGAVRDPAAQVTVANAPPVATKDLTLEPLLANLADADGHAYLRLGVTLHLLEADKKDKKEEKETKGPSPLEAGLRDSALGVLGRQQSADLLAADGKERLKKELLNAFTAHNPEARVHEVFFTDFLVQR